MINSKSGAARRRQLMKERNLEKVEVYLPARTKARLKASETAMQEGASFRLLPPVTFSRKTTSSKELNFMTDVSPWIAGSLYEELLAADLLDQDSISIKLVEGLNPSIEVTYDDLGRTAVMAVHGEQILISVLICPTSDVADMAAMNQKLLKAHKYLPLSTVGITTINDQDFYELFGALSSRSLVSSVASEIVALGENYAEVVSAFVEISDAA
jgi:uncharacterized protein YjfI (DUF2170 family)